MIKLFILLSIVLIGSIQCQTNYYWAGGIGLFNNDTLWTGGENNTYPSYNDTAIISEQGSIVTSSTPFTINVTSIILGSNSSTTELVLNGNAIISESLYIYETSKVTITDYTLTVSELNSINGTINSISNSTIQSSILNLSSGSNLNGNSSISFLQSTLNLNSSNINYQANGDLILFNSTNLNSYGSSFIQFQNVELNIWDSELNLSNTTQIIVSKGSFTGGNDTDLNIKLNDNSELLFINNSINLSDSIITAYSNSKLSIQGGTNDDLVLIGNTFIFQDSSKLIIESMSSDISLGSEFTFNDNSLFIISGIPTSAMVLNNVTLNSANVTLNINGVDNISFGDSILNHGVINIIESSVSLLNNSGNGFSSSNQVNVKSSIISNDPGTIIKSDLSIQGYFEFLERTLTLGPSCNFIFENGESDIMLAFIYLNAANMIIQANSSVKMYSSMYIDDSSAIENYGTLFQAGNINFGKQTVNGSLLNYGNITFDYGVTHVMNTAISNQASGNILINAPLVAGYFTNNGSLIVNQNLDVSYRFSQSYGTTTVTQAKLNYNIAFSAYGGVFTLNGSTISRYGGVYGDFMEFGENSLLIATNGSRIQGSLLCNGTIGSNQTQTDLIISENFELTSTGSLILNIHDPSNFSKIFIQGEFTLGGTLTIRITNPNISLTEEIPNILQYESSSGSFDQTNIIFPEGFSLPESTHYCTVKSDTGLSVSFNCYDEPTKDSKPGIIVAIIFAVLSFVALLAIVGYILLKKKLTGKKGIKKSTSKDPLLSN